MYFSQPALLQVICDLIRINYACADGFESVMSEGESLDEESVEILIQKAERCRKNAQELVALEGIHLNERMVPAGDIFNRWSEKRKLPAKKDKASLLTDCDAWEALSLEAYKSALNAECLTDPACRRVMMDQKYQLQVCHDKIKKYLDLQVLQLVSPATPAINIQSKFINTKAG